MLGLLGGAAVVFAAAGAQAAPDPRADEAVQLFDGMCVNMFRGRGPAPDGASFDFTKLDAATARAMHRDQGGVLWAASGKRAGGQMLIHPTPGGGCAVEVAEANAAAMRAAVDAMVGRLGIEFGSPAAPQPVRTMQAAGYEVTFRSWRMTASGKSVLVAFSSTAEPGALTQHMISVSYVQ